MHKRYRRRQKTVFDCINANHYADGSPFYPRLLPARSTPMLATLKILLPVFGLIFAGFACRRRGLLGPNSASELNRFVVWLALPALLFDTMARDLGTVVSAGVRRHVFRCMRGHLRADTRDAPAERTASRGRECRCDRRLV